MRKRLTQRVPKRIQSLDNLIERKGRLETLKTNVVLPKDLIKHIDEVASRRRRSEFLTQAAQEKLARVRFEKAAAKAFGSWKDEDHPELVSDGDMEKYLHRIRESTNERIQRTLK